MFTEEALISLLFCSILYIPLIRFLIEEALISLHIQQGYKTKKPFTKHVL